VSFVERGMRRRDVKQVRRRECCRERNEEKKCEASEEAGVL